MGFASIVRSGIALANSLTSDLQVTVGHYAWLSNNSKGESVYDTVVNLSAIVESGKEQMLVANGREILHKGTAITIIGPITANGGSNREEPIDPRDKLVLPDGSSGPILNVEGLVNPETGSPYMYEVFLG